MSYFLWYNLPSWCKGPVFFYFKDQFSVPLLFVPTVKVIIFHSAQSKMQSCCHCSCCSWWCCAQAEIVCHICIPRAVCEFGFKSLISGTQMTQQSWLKMHEWHQMYLGHTGHSEQTVLTLFWLVIQCHSLVHVTGGQTSKISDCQNVSIANYQ